MAHDEDPGAKLKLRRPVDAERDHLRGAWSEAAIVVVGYQDFLCPYCRQLRQVFKRLRVALGERLVYVFRHFPNERAHPGAELASRAAEAAGLQGKFYAMHDGLFDRPLPIGEQDIAELARAIGLDTERFARDLESETVKRRVAEDLASGRDNGVTGTPTLFVDELRYEGAWDFFSMLESLERPLAARVHRSARVFASLPTSAGLVLLVAALFALVCANGPLAALYERVMEARFSVGPIGHALTLSLRDWFSEGLLSVFFLLVGLEIRREMTTGTLTDRRAASLPIVAAVGGVVTPALVYFALNPGATAAGWPIPTATDIAFTLALLAVLGERIPAALRVFVAALAVIDDLLSILTLALVYPRAFAPPYALAVLASSLVLALLNRARVYRIWPYLVATLALWLSLHALGVHAALAGVLLAMALPTRPAPKATPLLAQAANALAELEHAESEARERGQEKLRLEQEPVWEWATQNLSAASSRLTSPAESIERTVAPWTAYAILPAFAFTATGVRLSFDFSAQGAGRILAGVVLGLALGKPLGIVLSSKIAVALGVAIPPEGVTPRQFVGAACLCGVGDTLALLMADRSFGTADASVAKLGVFVGSVIAGALGTLVLRYRPVAETAASH